MSSAKKSGADARMIAIPEHVVASELHSEVASKPSRRRHEAHESDAQLTHRRHHAALRSLAECR